jgi:hypothetical protein
MKYNKNELYLNNALNVTIINDCLQTIFPAHRKKYNFLYYFRTNMYFYDEQCAIIAQTI